MYERLRRIVVDDLAEGRTIWLHPIFKIIAGPDYQESIPNDELVRQKDESDPYFLWNFKVRMFGMIVSHLADLFNYVMRELSEERKAEVMQVISEAKKIYGELKERESSNDPEQVKVFDREVEEISERLRLWELIEELNDLA